MLATIVEYSEQQNVSNVVLFEPRRRHSTKSRPKPQQVTPYLRFGMHVHPVSIPCVSRRLDIHSTIGFLAGPGTRLYTDRTYAQLMEFIRKYQDRYEPTHLCTHRENNTIFASFTQLYIDLHTVVASSLYCF
jgi:hypothetical protein